MSSQSPVAKLPPELVYNVLRLSLEEIAVVGAADERDALFCFGFVCRAWCTASLGWPRLGVTSVEEATALARKLERDELERRRQASGRTTGVAWLRSAPPREMVVTAIRTANSESLKAYGALVHACPALDALTLVLEPEESFDPLLAELQRAPSASGRNLRSLMLAGAVSKPSVLVMCVSLYFRRRLHALTTDFGGYLAGFPRLETLDLSMVVISRDNEPTVELPSPFLSHLSDLHLFINTGTSGLNPQLFEAVVHSSPSLRSVTIGHIFETLPQTLPSLSSALTLVAPRLLHFTSEPMTHTMNDLMAVPTPADQAALLALIRTMVELETLTAVIHPDPLFFAALRTLPRLSSVHLFIASSISPEEVTTSLANATFQHLEFTSTARHAWDDAGIEAVRVAAEAAGILSFRYRAYGLLGDLVVEVGLFSFSFLLSFFPFRSSC